jgi:hypothetical protein
LEYILTPYYKKKTATLKTQVRIYSSDLETLGVGIFNATFQPPGRTKGLLKVKDLYDLKRNRSI